MRRPSAAAAVEGRDLQRGRLDALEAADVHRGHGLAVRAGAEAEGRAAAGRAEMVLDDVLVEHVGGERALRRSQPQLLARHEPQQIALAAAVRAVALHDLADLALDLERNAAAMAAAFVDHLVVLSQRSMMISCRLKTHSIKQHGERTIVPGQVRESLSCSASCPVAYPKHGK